jgi:hypothetical protein
MVSVTPNGRNKRPTGDPSRSSDHQVNGLRLPHSNWVDTPLYPA